MRVPAVGFDRLPAQESRQRVPYLEIEGGGKAAFFLVT